MSVWGSTLISGNCKISGWITVIPPLQPLKTTIRETPQPMTDFIYPYDSTKLSLTDVLKRIDGTGWQLKISVITDV